MSVKSDKAKEIFLKGANCAQSVISVFCEDYGLSNDLAFAITDGFGGGMKCGEICGAVSGGISVIGLANRVKCADTQNAKIATKAKTTELIKAFKGKYNDLSCRNLITGGRTHCADYVGLVVEILEEMGY